MSDNIEEMKKQIAGAEARAEKWQKLHTEAEIKRELIRAAEQGGARHAFQLMPYLLPDAKLIEVNGQQVVRIAKTDENGQEVLFTSDQAVAHLRQTKKLWNLFKAEPEAQPAPVQPDKIDLRKMTPELYIKIKAEHPEWLGCKPKGR